MSNAVVELKGSNFTLSVLHLHDADPQIIGAALAQKIAQAPAFLKNAPVVINVADLPPSVDFPALQRAIWQSGLRLIGVSGCKDETLKAQIIRAGLALLTEGKARSTAESTTTPATVSSTASSALPSTTASSTTASSTTASSTTAPPVSNTLIIDSPVRSGQRIYAAQNDLIVISQVSAGAELIADGNIHIYGVMRGRALAGASGNKQAQIFATQLAAELLSIAGVYWLSDQIPQDYYHKAARLRLTQGELSIALLN